MKEKDISLYQYRGDITRILLYEVLTKAIMVLAMFLHHSLSGLLLINIGRPAFSSGDLPYLLRSWQGWMLILLAFILLIIYTVFDINATILISNRLLRQQPIKIWPMLKEATEKMKNCRGIWGVVAIFYVTLMAPLTGATFGISLTSDFTMPEFITSVINSNRILAALYYTFLVIMGIAGFFHLFTFHFMIIGNRKIKDAMKESRRLIRQNWKDFLLSYGKFLLLSLLVLAADILIVYALPMLVVDAAKLTGRTYHAAIIFLTLLFVVTLSLLSLIFLYFLMMKLTLLYDRYTRESNAVYLTPHKKNHILALVVSACILVFLGIISYSLSSDFDTYFPAISSDKIIAHRAGGYLANENTVAGLEAAHALGITNIEIDVQRTKDGHYIINHDDNFLRCCGDERMPGEMTLKEIKEQLKVINPAHPSDPVTEVSTMEEMLDAAKGKVFTYIELKGESADLQMAEDVYQMVADRNMENDIMFISMKYELIEYLETHYPQLRTGYLAFFAFGDVADLKCDALCLESSVATGENINHIHELGKEINVWTINSFSSLAYFMTSDVDGIITDEVALAGKVRQFLIDQSDVVRVLQRLIPR